ncbi:MAG: DUF2723 domain-containing protein [Capsulimonadales bacterium]|nr:DUF2723 domain-containing protein [Capsulimonadales bacterium]
MNISRSADTDTRQLPVLTIPDENGSFETGATETPQDAGPALRLDRIVQAAITALTLLIYGMTMCRTLYTGDDGDFLTAMATGGNCHPTGYPLFLLLGKAALFLFAPFFPEPAARVNLLTVLCGSLAVGFFYRFLVSLRQERYLAATGALVLAFSPTLWQQSLSVEIYALTAAFLCGLLWAAAAWWEKPTENGPLLRMAAVYGLSCTNHMTMALFLPGFLLLVLYRRRTLLGRDWRVLIGLAGLFLLPLLLYLYLPWAAHRNPPVNWGDPSTPAALWETVTGKQYRTSMFRSASVFQTHAEGYFRLAGESGPGLLAKEFGFHFLWLIPVGLFAMAARGPRHVLLLVAWVAAVNLLFSFNYNIFDIYVYYIPSYIVATTWIVFGMSFLVTAAFDRFRWTPEQRRHYSILLAVILPAVPVVNLSINYVTNDRSGNRLEYDFTYNILRSAPKNAIITTIGSTTYFSLWYRKYVLGERPDVVIVNVNLLAASLAQRAWYYRHLRQQYPDIDNTYSGRRATPEEAARNDFLVAFLERAARRGVPVLWLSHAQLEDLRMDSSTEVTLRPRLARNFERRAWGIVERLYPKDRVPTERELYAENRRIWPDLRFGNLIAWAHADPFQEPIPIRYAEAFTEWGKLCEKVGQNPLAADAYRNAQSLYVVPEAGEGLTRLNAPSDPVTTIVTVPPDGSPTP